MNARSWPSVNCGRRKNVTEMDRVSRENWMKLGRMVRKARLMPKKHCKPKRRTTLISKPTGTFASDDGREAIGSSDSARTKSACRHHKRANGQVSSTICRRCAAIRFDHKAAREQIPTDDERVKNLLDFRCIDPVRRVNFLAHGDPLRQGHGHRFDSASL